MWEPTRNASAETSCVHSALDPQPLCGDMLEKAQHALGEDLTRVSEAAKQRSELNEVFLYVIHMQQVTDCFCRHLS